MGKKWISLIVILFACVLNAQALDLNDLFINPVDENIETKTPLTKNDTYNQYAIALDRYIQSNCKAAYTDFYVLIESASATNYLYLQMAEKLAELGFFDLSELSLSKYADGYITHLLSQDVKKYYFPATKLSKNDELYLAEMYSNIMYNDQSKEVVSELIKNVDLLDRYDYANYIAALGYFKIDDTKNAQKYVDVAILKNPNNANYKKLKAEILAQKASKDALKFVSEPLNTTRFINKNKSLNEYILYKIGKDEYDKKYHLAYYFYYEKDLNKAVRTLQTSFNAKKSNNKKVYALLSRVYYDLKDYEKAEDNAMKAYKMDKSNDIALSVLGDLSYRKEDYKFALKYYTSMRNLSDLNVARVYMKLQKTDKANKIYTKLLKTHSDLYEAYYNMALLDKQNEIEYLKQSLAVNYQYKDAWIDLARVELEQNKLDKAQEYLDIAKCIDENDFRYYYYQGLVYKKKGMPADAKRSFRKSLLINPKYVPAKEEL